jgi:hypothetical protein
MTSLAGLVRDFAALLCRTRQPDQGQRMGPRGTSSRPAGRSRLHPRPGPGHPGRDHGRHPFHNGRTEGVNTKTKMIKRQMYGRASFSLQRHRILLGQQPTVTTESATEPLDPQSASIRVSAYRQDLLL